MGASCSNLGGYNAASGSGESWFTSGGLRLEPRRGNAHRENGGRFFGARPWRAPWRSNAHGEQPWAFVLRLGLASREEHLQVPNELVRALPMEGMARLRVDLEHRTRNRGQQGVLLRPGEAAVPIPPVKSILGTQCYGSSSDRVSCGPVGRYARGARWKPLSRYSLRSEDRPT
jgi:hypothetical protein